MFATGIHSIVTVRLKTVILKSVVLSFMLALSVAKADSPRVGVMPEQPNIVILYMDDLGWKDIGVSGSQSFNTPHIDKLAANGIRFTRAYSPSPLCAPSRGALITGKFPGRTQYTSISSNGNDDSLYSQSKALGVGNQYYEALHRHVVPSTETTFAERFQQAGYRTCFIGKWHCGRQPGYHPRDRGYDETFAIRKGGGYPYYLTQEQIDGLENVPGAEPGDYLPELMTGWACEFMERQVKQKKPFLLHLSHFLVHAPITPKRDILAETQERIEKLQTDQDNADYATMVQAMDDSVGAIVDQLEAMGQLDNTLIVFTSDNGGYTGREVTSNYPLMGGKSFSFEGGYRVPFIAQWQGTIPASLTSDTRVIAMDIYPTILEAAGLPQDAEQHADGLSLMGEMMPGRSVQKLGKRSLYFHHPHYTHASSPHSIIIEGDYKLVRYYNDAAGRYALFNLQLDPGEQNDLSRTHPKRVKKLDKKLTRFLNRTSSLLPVPADSDEGRQLLAEHNKGENSGYNERFKNHTSVMNKSTERVLAYEERAIQESKLGIGNN